MMGMACVVNPDVTACLLDGQGMRFGDLISTSNAFEDSISEVSVETDEPLLWASGIHL